MAGGQNYGNEVLIDGVSQQRSENGSSYDEEAPSVEALAEFKVTTSLPEAEFGRTTGGVEDFVTKSGANAYHGTGYELYRDASLDANTFFNKGWRAYYCTGSNDTAGMPGWMEHAGRSQERLRRNPRWTDSHSRSSTTDTTRASSSSRGNS